MMGWRLRLWLRRLMPHTPLKRVGYAAALLLCAVAAALLSPVLGAGGAASVLCARLVDMQVGRRRLGRIPTDRGYFFEGHDHRPPRP